MKAPLPSNETARLQALNKYEILDTATESVFDDLTRLAAYICGVPTATISLIDRDRQWLKSKIGIEVSETPRDNAFCAHGILQIEPLIITDAQQDRRFANNPLVIGAPYIRFYAGVPLIDLDGFALGTLCVIDYVPRQLSNQQRDALVVVARQVMTQLTLRRNLAALRSATIQCQQAEKALLENEKKYRTVVDNVKEVIFQTDVTGLWTFLNPAWTEITEFTTDQSLGTNFLDYIHPQDRQQNLEIFQLLMQRQQEYCRYEVRYLTNYGGYRWIEVYACLIRDDNGAVLGTSGTLQDITENKQAAAAIKENEKLFKAVFNQAFQFIGLLTCDGTVVEVNQTFLDFGGVKLREVVGQTFWEAPWWRHSPVTQQFKKAIEQAQRGDFVRYEVDAIGVEDTKITIDFSIKPITDETGKVVLLLLEGRDITKRQQTEEALRSSLATNYALINALPDLMFRISADGTFVNFKASKTHNVPLPPEDFLGKNIYEVMPTYVAQLTMKGIEAAISSGELQIFECQMLIDDRTCYYETRIAASATDEAMVIVRDITERKQAETEIRKALETEKNLNELKSRFITMTSHEFRTPLTTILSSAELIEDFGNIWSENKKAIHFNRIKANVKHMTQLLDDVILIGRAEVGQLECNPTKLDAVQFCRDLVEEIYPNHISNNHITFVSQVAVLDAYLDEKLLRHILSNLLANAIKYSPTGGTIDFYLSCQEQEISFQIQDRGIGIPSTELEHLFSSFYRASNVGNISGTGLGLAIVKKAVDLHQGKIAVESELGVGTTFLVSFPLIQEQVYEQDFNN